MLLTATQAAFNGVLELLDESLDLYQDMRDRLPATSRKAQLDLMLEQRQQLQEKLRQAAVEELHIRPRTADQDIEGLTHLLEQFRRLWQEPETVALDLLLDHEQELQRACEEVLQEGGGELSADLQILLAELEEHLEATELWLQH
ncbi:hypothetical protein SAMN05660443_0972 [Marinospirillum celere]|uniref:DUF2383 domain-containing protein n=1 Tax=Marinospirillum celere TaxID=1122252 RepID=A0A1I1FFJ5_9GAMM|nr:hypothetical protein [Marinospirillum celere]SFB97762.1 hypothetical protein SAMN05660443_0972 [Marinospirillum celere]